MLLTNLRNLVLDKAKQMVADGLSYGASGNISALDPDSGMIAITPSAVEYRVMTLEDIVVIDREGKLVEGKWKPTSETPMHTIFYRKRNDVGAVVHTHSPYATVFATIGEPIPMILSEAARCIGAPVKVTPYIRPGTQELAQQVLEAMADDVALLLGQHGALAVGCDLHSAYNTAMSIEFSARILLYARCAQAMPSPLDPAEVKELRRLYHKDYHPTGVANE